jgi:hypothetical protein
MPATIAGLAAELGVHQMRVRQWLRRHRPRPESQKWMRYELSEGDAAAVRAAFAARAAAVAIPPEDRDWFWEGNVQIRIADYLEGTGWLIEHTADTASGERGDDIRARRGADVLRVEVKGWPSEDYANPSRASEKKRTRPSTQAGHWYSQALLRAIRDLGRHPDDLAAIGLPDWPRFRRLLDDTRAPLARLGVGVYFVATDRSVDEAMAPRHYESVG